VRIGTQIRKTSESAAWLCRIEKTNRMRRIRNQCFNSSALARTMLLLFGPDSFVATSEHGGPSFLTVTTMSNFPTTRPVPSELDPVAHAIADQLPGQGTIPFGAVVQRISRFLRAGVPSSLSTPSIS